MAQACGSSNDVHQFKTELGIEIVVYVGDILNLQAQGIVLGEGQSFKELGFVAKSLLEMDPKFKESRDKLIAKNNSSFRLWNAYSSPVTVGKHFKFGIHAVIAQCTPNKEDMWIENMIGLYKKVFDEANSKKINILALPLLGSGRGHASEGVAAEAAIKAIKTFEAKYLRKIYIVTNKDTIRKAIVAQCITHLGPCRPLPMPPASHSRPASRSGGRNDGGAQSVGAMQPSVSSGSGRATPERRKEWQASRTKDFGPRPTRMNDKTKQLASISRSDSRQKYIGEASSHDATKGGHVPDRGRGTASTLYPPTGNMNYSDRHANHKINDAPDQGDRFRERSYRSFNTDHNDNNWDTNGDQESRFDEDILSKGASAEPSMNGAKCMTVSAIEKHDGDGVNYSRRNKEELERGNRKRENTLSTSSPRDTRGYENYRKMETCPIGANKETFLDGRGLYSGTKKGQSCFADYEDTCVARSSGRNAPTGETGASRQETSGLEEEETCPICLSEITDLKKLSRCGHTFCRDCIDNSFANFKPVCPSCNMVYGVIYGAQPNGKMDVDYDRFYLPGYEHYETITITYHFPNGNQGPNHPSPGSYYKGTTRVAYLPDNKEGREVLGLLKTAFDRKLTFTIGRSTTTGQDNVVTWNDIHHKTNIEGGPTKFGYPDPTYLKRVKEELASKGVTL